VALLNFYQSNPELVLAQTVQQVVSNAGDGNLLDDTLASAELREFLGVIPNEALYSYSRQCLESSFPTSGYVLQDIVNEFGRRLDFEVENGLYRGRRGAIGVDGVWRFQGEPALIVEVKTTDAYTVRLETIVGYREALIEAGRVPPDTSILVVVGREDTGSLEAQVRGSRYAWDIRLISVERLVKLVQIKEKSDDPATIDQIRQLLHPFEYTKVDRIIDVIFTTAVDVEIQQEESRSEPDSVSVDDEVPKRTQSYTDSTLLNAKRDSAVCAFADLKGKELFKRTRTFFWSKDRHLRVCCTVSKRYEGEYQPYWYAYHPKWDAFLSDGEGYLILCCMDLDSAFAIPRSWFAKNLDNLNTTERPDGQHYWHLALTTLPDGTLALNVSRVG
jgi:hypothetical protein